MRLADRDPKFGHVGDREDSTCYLHFRCPCRPECERRIAVPFSPDLQEKPAPPLVLAKCWTRESGSTFEDLTLSPSIWLHASDWDGHPGWHRFLRNGDLQPC